MTNFPGDINIYPLLLDAVPRERIWGGRMLAQLMHKTLPGDGPIGETWEAWPGCRILAGRHAGLTLGALVEREGPAILGSATGPGGAFPLLFKYLDARDYLSVQVHPDDAQAQALEAEAFGKTEAWYVLQAEPGATLIHGFRRDTSAEEFAAALEGGRLAELLESVAVQAGDVVFLPAGTVHALGRGMVIAEIQQNSDLTYRLYDWERRDAAGKPRELHVDKGLQVAEYRALHAHKVAAVAVPEPYGERQVLVACRYFAWELLVVRQAAPELTLDGRFHILAVLAGSAQIRFGPGGAWSAEVRAGQTVVAPAGLERYGITPLEGECRLLRMYVPELSADVIEPLRRAGVEEARIAQLGGPDAAHNDVAAAMGAKAR